LGSKGGKVPEFPDKKTTARGVSGGWEKGGDSKKDRVSEKEKSE